MNRSVLARTEDTSAGRYSPICIVAHVDVNQPEAATCAQNAGIGGEIGIDGSPKIVNAHVYGWHTPTELRCQTGMPRKIDQRGDDASVIVVLVGRTRELGTIRQVDRDSPLFNAVIFGNSQ